jgi:hypothetical protein
VEDALVSLAFARDDTSSSFVAATMLVLQANAERRLASVYASFCLISLLVWCESSQRLRFLTDASNDNFDFAETTKR